MKNPNDVAESYLAAWNEADADKRHALIEGGWTPNAKYLDPMMQGENHDGLNAMIGQARLQFPGLRFHRVGEAQRVGNCVRFSWHLAPQGTSAEPLASEKPVAGGTDFCVLSADGRLQNVTGFVDFFNAPTQEEA